MSAAAGTPAEDGGDRPWQSYHTAYTNAKAGTGALSPSVPLALGVFGVLAPHPAWIKPYAINFLQTCFNDWAT